MGRRARYELDMRRGIFPNGLAMLLYNEGLKEGRGDEVRRLSRNRNPD